MIDGERASPPGAVASIPTRLAFVAGALLRGAALLVASFALPISAFGLIAYPRSADRMVTVVLLAASAGMTLLAVLSFVDRRLRIPGVIAAGCFLPLAIAAMRGDFS